MKRIIINYDERLNLEESDIFTCITQMLQAKAETSLFTFPHVRAVFHAERTPTGTRSFKITQAKE